MSQKIKARDIGKFIVTHKGQLQECLNKPQVDLDKACARLLLHKALQDKYKFIRNRFADVPIKDLLMSRQERLKIKKEARDKQKEKRDRKNKKKNSQVVNAEGDWNVEDVNKSKNVSNDDEKVNDESGDDNMIDDEGTDLVKDSNDEGSDNESNANESEGSHSVQNSDLEDNEGTNKESEESDNDNDESDSEKFIKLSPVKNESKPAIQTAAIKNLETKLQKRKPEKKHKDNKNLNEKILKRTFKKDSDDVPISQKVVDPFFITSSGENYLTLAEPRQPDEVKEVHKQGNRQLRRAIMFGHVPKPRPRQDRQDNYRQKQDNYSHDNFNRQNGYDNRSNEKFEKQNGKFNKDDRRSNFKGNDRNERNVEEKPEKLHPSWEAKKKQSGILPFQGKKIVFDES